MFKINKIIAAVAVFGAVSAQAMQPVVPRYESLCVRCELDNNVKQDVYDACKDGFDKAHQVVSDWNGQNVGGQGSPFRHKTTDRLDFTKKPSKGYHISLCVVEPPKVGQYANTNLGGHAQGKLVRVAKKEVNPIITIQKTDSLAHVYEVLMMTHGYDAQGQEVNKHYDQFVSGNNLKADFQGGISHIHFSLRHGTYGILRDMVEKKLTPEINNMKTVMSNPYEGKFDKFCGHITIGKISKLQGGKGKIDVNTPRFNTQPECVVISKMYNCLLNSFNDKNNVKALNIKAKGGVPIDRISMRGFQINNGQVVGDHEVKADISK